MLTSATNTSLALPLTGEKLMGTSPERSAPATATAELTRRLACGQEDAFREFHSQYFDRLYRFLLVTSYGQEQEAQEALQQTFIRVLRYIRVFESEEVFWGWLKSVARSAARDRWRKQRRYSAVLERFALGICRDPGPPPNDEESRLSALLEEGLASLASEDRLLLENKYLHGFSLRDISLQTGLSEKTVESRLHRLRLSVRARLLKKLRDHET